MSLEINEIAIRMRVGADDREDDERPRRADGAAARGGEGCDDLDREAIVEACVQRALAILRTLAER